MKTVFPSFLSAVDRLSWFLFALFTSWIVLGSADTKQTSWPLHSKKPVLFIWNAPTQHCENEKEVKLLLDQFDIVSSTNVPGQNHTLFYRENLGIYPYYDNKGGDMNGGLPQSVNLSQHLEKMSKDLDKYIPDRKAKGLTVIDWEEWNPLWYANTNTYRKKSQDLVAKNNPEWTQGKVESVAKQEFELAAPEFMLETLRLGKNLRPNQLWGYYQFPECFNPYYSGNLESYRGLCPLFSIENNDQLYWMWNESTAIFPEIYLQKELKFTDQGRRFVLNRVKEAMRVGSVGDGLARPVFVYTRPFYKDYKKPFNEKELVNTIGESVALGAAGVTFWGGPLYDKEIYCKTLNHYLWTDMLRYLLNVTTAAKECSQKLCNFNGRCLRRKPNTVVFLHLSPSTHSIKSQRGKLKVTGSPGKAELEAFRQHFKCQCYNGTKGENCKLEEQGGRNETGQRDEREGLYLCSATSVLGIWPLCFVLQLRLLSLFH